MKTLACALLFLTARLASAAIINVEFKFTPFLGNPATDQEVTTVPGKTQIFINDVPYGAEQEVRQEKLPVLFDEHEVGPSVALSMSSAGSIVRKGKNKVRIEFTPNDPAKSYRAQLRWASVTDEPTSELDGNNEQATNRTAEGVDDRKDVKGKVVFEREFTADFALDLPWHHYPAVQELTEDDKQKMVALLKTRADWFQPDFSALYKAIEENDSLKVDDVRSAHCLEAAYKAGVRVSAPTVADLNFTTTGGPEVIVTRKAGTLFGLDEKTFAAVKDEGTEMCAGMVLATVYPGRMGIVRRPDGTWETVD
ncbi:MAG: hypothetical protein ABI233_09920 [Chthoniobacterales bacterium]